MIDGPTPLNVASKKKGTTSRKGPFESHDTLCSTKPANDAKNGTAVKVFAHLYKAHDTTFDEPDATDWFDTPTAEGTNAS